MNKIRLLYEKVMGLYKGKAGDIAYYLAFSFVYLFRFYYTSMFTTLSEKPLFLAVPYYAGLLVLLAFSLLAIADAASGSRKEAVFLSAILVACVLNAVVTRQFDYLLPFFLLILASRNRNVRPVFLISVILGSVFLLAAYYASMNGYIPYLVYADRGNTGMLSHAFGMVYRTDLAAHVFYIIMCYVIVRAEKLHLWEYLMLWFDVWLIWRYTWARTGCLCMAVFLVIIGVALISYHLRKKWFGFPWWSSLIHIVCAVFSFCAVALWYFRGDGLTATSDGASLRDRLIYSIQAFQRYPLKLFGQIVQERGAGGIPDTSQPYYYLDILYVRLLFFGGIMLFILFLCLMTIASLKAAKEQQVILAIALIIVAVDSMIEHHACNMAYNVLMIYSMGYFELSRKPELS